MFHRRRWPWVLLALLLAALLAWRGARGRRHDVQGPAPATEARRPPVRAAPWERPVARRRAIQLSSAVAQTASTGASGTFEGRVLASPSGRPVARASVTFAREGVTRAVSTGPDGSFRFTADPPGRYELVSATAEGYFPFDAGDGDAPALLSARPGARITGITIYLVPRVNYLAVVVDTSGRPLPGATLRVVDPVSGAPPTAPGVVSDGRGELRFQAPDGALLEARCAGHAPGRERLDFAAQASRRVHFRLAAGVDDAGTTGLLAGRVVDPRGEGVPGALVLARFAREAPDDDRHAGDVTTSGPDGSFAFEGLDRGAYDVTARASGLVPATAPAVLTGTRDLRVTLLRGATLRGVVREAVTRRAVAGFTIVVARRLGGVELGAAEASTRYDVEGRYEVTGLAAGRVVVTAVAHGLAPSADRDLTLPDGGDVVADFELARGGRVAGRVVDARSGAALEGARVALEGRLGEGRAAVPLLAATETDRDGRFVLGGLAAGLRSLAVAAEGHHGRILSGLAVQDEGELGPLTVELTPTEPGEQARTELAGIGAVLAGRGDALVVNEVVPGGGAAEAGIVPGDALVAVDGEAVATLGFDGAIQRVRGPEGSVVRVALRRGDAGAVVLAVPRRRIRR